MNSHSNPAGEPSALENIAALVAQLEESWSSGQESKIEDVLRSANAGEERASEASTPDESSLLTLIQTEMELRRRKGESIDVEEYAARFPTVKPELLNELILLPVPPKRQRSSLMLPVRYQLRGLLGQGGIGQVWRAFDTHMRRLVAIKVVHDRYRTDEKANRRLEREATLTGSLEHPGVPAVHDHGKLADGSGYVVMELVDGQTLAERLAKSQDSNSTDLVGVFSQIAQTIAYAHSLGVVHRDLKPQNVMVGQFGEVQVMDWGMAKLRSEHSETTQLTSPETTDTNAVSSVSNSNLKTTSKSDTKKDSPVGEDTRSLTQAGEIFGTPAYMAPEQARGAIDQVGPPSDVYGLGAILFEILTGKRLGSDDSSNRESAALAESKPIPSGSQFSEYRNLALLDTLNLDKDLAQLCRQCLQADPAARPQNGSMVAEQIASYQRSVESKLRQAQLDQSAAEIRASEERKRRKTTLRMAAGIVAAIAIGMAGVLYQWNSAIAARNSSEEHRQLAQQRFLLAKSTVDEYLVEVSQSRELLASTPGTQALRRTLLEKAKTYYEAFAASQPDSPQMQAELADAYLALGRIRRQLETTAEPTESLLKCIDISTRLVEQGFAPDQSRLRVSAAALELSQLFDDLGDLEQTEVWLDEAIDQILTLSPEALNSDTAQIQLAQAYHNLAVTKSKLGEDVEAEDTYGEALELETKLLAINPDDQRLARLQALSRRQIAEYHRERGEFESATQMLESANKILTQFEIDGVSEAETQHTQTMVNLTLADVYWESAETDAAIELLDESLEVAQELARQNPLILSYKFALGDTYAALAYNLSAQDDDRCLDVLAEGVPYLRQAVQDHPANVKLAHLLGEVLSQRAERYLALERNEEGLRDREESLVLHTQIHESDPSNRDAAVQVIDDYKTVGILRRRAGDPDGAAEAYSTAIEMIESLEAAEKTNTDLLTAKAGILNNLGFLYVSTNRVPLAMEPYEKAAALYGQIADGDSNRVEYYFQASTLTNIAYALLEKDENADALTYLDQAVELLQSAFAARPNELRVHNFLFSALTLRADVLNNMGKHSRALEDLDFAMKLNGGPLQSVAAIKRHQTRLRLTESSEWRSIVEQAIELAGSKRSDFLVESANAAAQAAYLASQANETELVDHFAAVCAEQLTKALDLGNFQMLSPKKIATQGRSMREIWDHPAMAETASRIDSM